MLFYNKLKRLNGITKVNVRIYYKVAIVYNSGQLMDEKEQLVVVLFCPGLINVNVMCLSVGKDAYGVLGSKPGVGTLCAC